MSRSDEVKDGSEVLEAPSDNYCHPTLQVTINSLRQLQKSAGPGQKLAIAELEKAQQLSGNNSSVVAELAWAYAAAGRKEDARRLLQELSQKAKTSYVSPYRLAAIHLALSETDAAITLLQKADAERTWEFLYLNVDPNSTPCEITRSLPSFGSD